MLYNTRCDSHTAIACMRTTMYTVNPPSICIQICEAYFNSCCNACMHGMITHGNGERYCVLSRIHRPNAATAMLRMYSWQSYAHISSARNSATLCTMYVGKRSRFFGHDFCGGLRLRVHLYCMRFSFEHTSCLHRSLSLGRRRRSCFVMAQHFFPSTNADSLACALSNSEYILMYMLCVQCDRWCAQMLVGLVV